MFPPLRLQGYLHPEPHRWLEWVSVSLMLVMATHGARLWLGSGGAMSWRRMLMSTLMVMCALEIIGRQTIIQFLPLYNLVKNEQNSYLTSF